MTDDDILKEAKEAFTLVSDYEQENRNLAEAREPYVFLG